MIEVNSLVKRYGDYEAVRGVSFSVSDGGVMGLLGPNGAGKTTIMKVLTGYHRSDEGSAILDGIDVDENPEAVKEKLGYLPEGVPLYLDMTVAEYLDFIARARKIPKAEMGAAIDKAMAACGLGGMGPVRLEHLSKGFRQRVGLAQAIVHDPPILILDEPTTGLDPNQILEIRQLIRSLGEKKTVILSTHILQEVEALCNKVIILNEGQVAAQGSPREIAASLKGEEKLEVTVSGIAADGVAKLKSDAFSSLTHTAIEDGRLALSLKAPSARGDEAAERVFRWAVSEGGVILELRREKLSIEDIFVQLTREDEQ